MRILITIFFLIHFNDGFSQTPNFEYQRLLESTQQMPTFSFEDENGDFVIATSLDNNTGLIKLDSDGNLIGSQEFDLPGIESYIWHIQEEADQYISIGTLTSFNPDSSFVWIVAYDLDLSILESKQFFLGNFEMDWFYQCNTQYADTTICVGMGSISSGPPQSIAFKFIELDQVQIMGIHPGFQNWTVDLIIDPSNPNRYFVNGSSQTDVFDANFSHLNTIEYPYAPWLPQGDYEPLTDSTFLHTGKYWRPDDVKELGIAILDYGINEVNLVTIGQPDIRDSPASTKSVDVFDDFIYAGGTSNALGPTLWEVNSHFILGKFYKDLEEIWVNYYGGDAYYDMHYLHATKDGGCLMVGTKHDFENNPGIAQLYALKVDGNGEITNTTTIPLTPSIATIYPNPTSTHFVVEIENEAILKNDVKVELYDLLGRKLFDQKINNQYTEIDVSGFAAATYFVIVKDGQGNVMLDEKVVKVD